MNVFNRVALLSLGIVLLPVCAALAVLAAGWLPAQTLAGAPWLPGLLAPLASLGG